MLFTFLSLGALVEAVPLWQLLEVRVTTAADNPVSEPLMLVGFAIAMGWSARQIRRRPSAD
jgi:hypothetical protein